MPKLNPRTSKYRLLECARCHEPVASSAWSGRVTLRCGYCAFEDERELGLLVEDDGEHVESSKVARTHRSPYRDTAPVEARTTKLLTNLDVAPPGVSAKSVTGPALRALMEESASAEGKDEDDAIVLLEWKRVWLAVWLAWKLSMQHDAIKARVALETTLEVTRTPAYRALLLARLAQHAGSLGAPALAKKWLRACPDVGIAEIDSEVRAAKAMLALARDQPEKVRALTGDTFAGAGFTGVAACLAVALNVEAHERNRDFRLADAILADVVRKGLLLEMINSKLVFKVGQSSLDRFRRKLRRREAIWAAAPGLLLLILPAIFHVGIGETLVATLVAAGGSAMGAWALFEWRLGAPSVWKRRLRSAAGNVLQFGCVVIAALWLATTRPPPTPTTIGGDVSTSSAVVTASPSSSALKGNIAFVADEKSDGVIELKAVNESALDEEELLKRARFADMEGGRDGDVKRLARLCLRRNPANEGCAALLSDEEKK